MKKRSSVGGDRRGQLEWTRVSFLRSWVQGIIKNYDVRALYDIRWRICSGAIKRQEESCAAKGKHAWCSKGEVFLNQHGRVVKV